MTLIEKLKWMIDKQQGLGIPIAVIAKYSNCHPSTISNYIKGKSSPTRRLEALLENGIYTILTIIKEKIGE